MTTEKRLSGWTLVRKVLDFFLEGQIMPGGFSNRPNILRGAFVEYGLSLPPLMVVFQFNPLQLSHNRSLSIKAPGSAASVASEKATDKLTQLEKMQEHTSLRKFHQSEKDLLAIRDKQVVEVDEQTFSLELKFDATDKLDEGDAITEQFGLAPQLATLESMVNPKDESLLGEVLNMLSPGGFSFTRSQNPPLILFIWGRKWVLPVNINSMNITETEFSADLNPLRATVSVGLTVIEGENMVYKYSRVMKEAMSILNLANVTDITNIIIPG
jgi:hypothetical protein